MDEIEKHRWQALVDSFQLPKKGVDPWDALELAEKFTGASHGERCVIQFLLNLWDAGGNWECGKFDVIEAYSVWDEKNRNAFLGWATDPWWP